MRFKLIENRSTLKPKSYISKSTGKIHWSPYDYVERKFATYDVRYSYDTLGKCKDAIADEKNLLGYTEPVWKELNKGSNEDEEISNGKEPSETNFNHRKGVDNFKTASNIAGNNSLKINKNSKKVPEYNKIKNRKTVDKFSFKANPPTSRTKGEKGQ